MTTVNWQLEQHANTTFAIDFYTLSSINASGYGEGRSVLGSTTLTTNVTGNADFVFEFPTPAGGARFITATATDPERQHIGILAGVRCRHPADGRHRFHEALRQ